MLYAEPNYIVEKFAVPNDPSFPSQWNLHNTGQNGGTPGADIHAVEAWDITSGKWTKKDEKLYEYVLAVAEWRGYSATAGNVYVTPLHESLDSVCFRKERRRELKIQALPLRLMILY